MVDNLYNNYDDIRREYENIRLKNSLLSDDIRNKIYDENPILKDLDLKIMKSYMDIGLNKIDGNATSELQTKLDKLIEERNKYISTNNIDPTYRDTKYDCNKCKDTGFIDGKKCSCFIKKEIELFDKISHFKNYIKEDNFDNLDLSFYKQSGLDINGLSYSEYMKNAVNSIKSGIELMDDIPYNIILIGPPGTGKTFLSRCAGAYALEHNKSVLYVNVNEYISSLKPDYAGEPLETYAIAADLFILDDLGTENISDFTNTKLNYIIDKRLNDKKSTIITTNLMLSQIRDNYMSQMYSRISHAYISCYLAGEDLRRIKNANI